jgi:diguanylate cyclase (GGDEF)-like protein
MNRLQVLIIDDDKETAEFLRTVLSLVGFECEVILSAKQALIRLAGNPPDLILLDLRLGLEIGGAEILYQIRANPRYDHTRVIIITAYPTVAEPITNLADLVLLKPVEVDQLKTLATRLGTFDIGQRRYSFRDPITELFNQEFFTTRVELAYERARRRDDFQFGVLLFVVVPAPKQTEEADPDLLVGLLREIATRLRKKLRPTDTIARFSGWKFAILNEEMKRPDDLHIIIERLEQYLQKPYEIRGETLLVRTAYGSVMNTRSFNRPEDIIQAAENRLEQAIEELQSSLGKYDAI